MSVVIKAAQVLLATLREIFDEAAYARFLDRKQIRSSSAAHAAFWREKESVGGRPTRCC
jgi:hypothetical protein